MTWRRCRPTSTPIWPPPAGSWPSAALRPARSTWDVSKSPISQYAREYQASDIRARYRVAQTVIVRTPNVDRVQQTSRALDGLVRQGVVLQDYNGPSYIFTKLNSVRGPMIAEATASARNGAQQFARDSESNLGGIAQATQGSFEILGRDEIGDESSQVFKRVRVVTTITYRLR